jgi:hypothetical protein
MAQALVDTPSQGAFNRDRNISVLSRPHHEYDPNGMRLGSLMVLPKLEAGVEDNDNIYARQANTTADTIVTATPEIDLQSNWRRDALQAFVKVPVREYAKHTGESTTDWQVGGLGRLDIARGAIALGGDTGFLTEPRTSNITSHESIHPVRYSQSDLLVGAVQDLGRVRLSARYDFQRQDYQDGVDNVGVVVPERYRTHDSDIVTGKAEYAISPAASLFVDAAYNLQRYDLPSSGFNLNRDSQGGFFDVGASFELSSLIRGQMQVGYLKQTFANAAYTPISGLSAQGKLEWFPTQLTTITLSGSRSVQDSGIIGSSAYLAEVAGLELDHELLRNLILIARASYEADSFNGIDRRDHNVTGALSARYQMNRLVGFMLGYTYLDQVSAGAPSAIGPRYIVNRIVLTTRLTL